MSMRTHIIAYLFLFPAFAFYLYFVGWPALQTFFTSLTEWDGIGPKHFVGLQNYVTLFSVEPVFWTALKHTLMWVIASMTIPVWLGLVLSSLIVRGNARFGKWFQMIFFLPQVISMVIASVIWKWILDPTFGPLNVILRGIGLDSLATGWLGDPQIVMFALFIIYLWQTFGFCVIIFTAAIQGVDSHLYEAARIDGCGSFGQFRYITIPGIHQALTSVIVLMTVGSFSIFDLVMTTTSGGPGYSSYVISIYVFYQGFIVNRVGLGSAASIILTLFVLVATRLIIYFRERNR